MKKRTSVTRSGWQTQWLRWQKLWVAQRPVARLLRLNHYVFPHLYEVANVLFCIELFTYRGFTARYLFLESRIIMMTAVLSFLVILWENLRKPVQLPGLTKLVLDLNKLAVIPLLLINFLLISINNYFYPNYVYSTFHINTNNFQLMFSFNVVILILQFMQYSKSFTHFIQRRLHPSALINVIFLLAIGAFLLPNLQIISTWMYDASNRILRTLTMSWEERFIYLNGGENSTGWIRPYTNFVNKHVAERGVIFIPPQKEAWQMEGNEYYMRWFLYPRFTVQSPEIVAPIPPQAEYILIDNGAWPGMTEYGWPRISIPASQIEKMVFIDRDTRVETVVTGQDYDPKTMSHKWGVIQLKK